MTGDTPSDPVRGRLAVLVGVAALVAVLGEGAARRFLEAPPGPREGTHRSARVRVFANDPDLLPVDLVGRRSLLLIGNSHTYALPGLRPGLPLRADPGSTLVDRLELRLEPDPGVTFDRLSYPNFLPFEMLTRVAHLHTLGYRPRVVVLGLTWRNLARDSALRHEIHMVYRIAMRAEAIRELLALPQMATEPEVLAAVDAERREAEVATARERTRSLADRYDDRASRWLGGRIALLGESAALRAQLYRSIVNWAQVRLGGTQGTRYDVIRADLHFNLACLRALLRLFQAQGAQVILYWAPERNDLPPMMDSGPQQQVMDEVGAWAAGAGQVVIDARRAVPNEYWGWDRETPDRSHFTEPGHEELAAFLARHTPPPVWSRLTAP